MPPALVVLRRKRHMHEWPPFRPLRFADQSHVRLMRVTISLPRVTSDTRTDDVFPRRQSPLIPRQDVIQIQFRSLENSAAILAGVFVALENVMPGKLHFLLRQPVEQKKHDDSRHPDFPRNRGDDLMVGSGDGEIAPARKIMGQKIIGHIGRDDLGVALIKEGKGASGGTDIYRLPEAVEHQDLSVK
ncbi:MAG: hypothetical protein V7609_255 [Verrucomicrobiota bacterium]